MPADMPITYPYNASVRLPGSFRARIAAAAAAAEIDRAEWLRRAIRSALESAERQARRQAAAS